MVTVNTVRPHYVQGIYCVNEMTGVLQKNLILLLPLLSVSCLLSLILVSIVESIKAVSSDV